MNTLELRALERKTPGLVHVHAAAGPPLPPELEGLALPCCMGAAVYDVTHCTCWEPEYDQPQTDALLLDVPTVTLTACCHDCAYRPGSAERADPETEEELLDLPGGQNPFWCHQGMRRVLNWRHPALSEFALDLRIQSPLLKTGELIVPAGPGDYRPPILDGRPYRADGHPAAICAGWAARHRKLLA